MKKRWVRKRTSINGETARRSVDAVARWCGIGRREASEELQTH